MDALKYSEFLSLSLSPSECILILYMFKNKLFNVSKITNLNLMFDVSNDMKTVYPSSLSY